MTATVETVADWVRGARSVVALTGAGISTESGIPDFRGPDGVWTRNPEAERLATLQYYVESREARVRSWQNRLEHPAWVAAPNAGHVALVDLERKGHLHVLVTQNVDGLHQLAGSSPDIVVEVHGTIHEVECLQCGERAPMERALERVKAGEDDPSCRTCGGILKSATISFGQELVPSVIERARDAAAACDLLLAVGTSLGVYPVAYLPQYAVQAGARLVIINEQETPYDRVADAVLHERIGTVLPAITDLV